jgi:hypothetical protein
MTMRDLIVLIPLIYAIFWPRLINQKISLKIGVVRIVVTTVSLFWGYIGFISLKEFLSKTTVNGTFCNTTSLLYGVILIVTGVLPLYSKKITLQKF